MLGLALLIALMFLRQRQGGEVKSLSEDEEARLAALLDDPKD